MHLVASRTLYRLLAEVVADYATDSATRVNVTLDSVSS